MKIANGRTHFYQWELNQRLVLDVDCGEVHYENGTQSTALCCAVNEVNGVRECDVPNELLQTASDLHAFAWNKEKTHVVGHAVFTVIPRTKPDDYVYTETEVWTAEKAVAEALEKAKASGEFNGEQGDPGPVGPQGETGPQGYSPVRGVDYWTEADKTEIVEETEKTAIGDIEKATDEILKMQEELLDGVGVQFGGSIFTESEDHPGCYYIEQDGVQYWLNPPMLYGVEYYTMEKCGTKPVRTMRLRIDISDMWFAGVNTKSITISETENLLLIDAIKNVDDSFGYTVPNHGGVHVSMYYDTISGDTGTDLYISIDLDQFVSETPYYIMQLTIKYYC